MPKRSTKSLSNRRRLADKYRVEKRVKAHHKKQKKLAKKNPLWRSKIKKDPGIPNLVPFKEKLMSLQKESHETEQRGKQRQQREQSLAQMAQNAQGSADAFEKKQQQTVSSTRDNLIPKHELDSSRKAFYKELKKVVGEADVVLEVLDARDPIGSRSISVEQEILAKGKKMILVLNKIDLVPKEVVQAWLTHLRHELPTIAFRCNTQDQRSKLGRAQGDFDTYASLDGAGACLGGDNLMELLKNYCRSEEMKVSITVGIIGYPNTGKSSLINSLKRAKVASVGAKPGHTRHAQEVKLDKNIVLIDCPGIVFAQEGEAFNSADIVLRNAVEMEKIDDPVSVVEAVLKRCPRERLMELYEIPRYTSADEFLAYIAHKMGKLKKGGVPDYKAASVTVLRDWVNGKIKFYTMPPEKTNRVLRSTVVAEWAPLFNLDQVVAKESAMMASLPQQVEGAMMMDVAEEEEEYEYDDDDEEEEMDMMELSEDSDSMNGSAVPTDGASMAMFVSSKKKRTARSNVDEEPVELPVSKSKKKKQHKREKKRHQADDDDEAMVDAPFDFDSFEPLQVSEKQPDLDDQNYEFRY